MRYHVFIEGCRDTTAAGIEILAGALGQRYGMSPPAVIRRLKEGRFCARASLDLPSAQRLVGELEAIGAHASLVGEGAPAPGAARYESGLAAAFAGERLRDDVRVDLGPLGEAPGEEITDAGWELASVDGSHEQEQAAQARALRSLASKGPPPPPLPPPAPRPAAGRDPFQPPDAGTEALPELAESITRVTPAPRVTALPASPPGPLPRAVAPAGSPLRRVSLVADVRESLASSPRARFAAGVLLAFLIGLLPAQILAWSRADSAYDDIRAQLRADYAAADTPERWAALAVARADAFDLARTRQQRMAVSSGLLWLAVAGAVAYVWFRVLDWPRAPS